MRKVLFLTVMILVIIVGAVCANGGQEGESKGTIVFADMNWDSIQVHNRIAKHIIEDGLGYTTEFTQGSTINSVTALIQGDIDVVMESWTENIQELYDKGIESGSIIDLGNNFSDSAQGWYVPTYMIEGDKERGIEATAPNLEHVKDLPEYWELFKDPEDPKKGRIYIGVPGWKATEMSREKMEKYNLTETYNEFIPGSDAALAGSMIGAYKKGNPWLGYYWEPTWVMGKVDMTLLEGSQFPPNQVNILVYKTLPDRAPDVVEFFKNYETSSAINNEFLAVMADNELTTDEAAVWFLKNRQDVWTEWVSSEVEEKVKASLEG